MELTEQQIKQVENYLEQKKFNFVDLKHEILDHIISDIENFMQKGNTFEEVFARVKIRWEKHFRETSSFFFGMLYSNSKIVVNKAVKQFKYFYFLYLAAYILPVAFLKVIPIQVSKGFANSINEFLSGFTFSMLIYIGFIIFKIIQFKQKTTYSFILKTQFFGTIFLVLAVFVGSVFKENGEMNPVFTGFVCAGFTVVYICHHFFKKHKEVVTNHQISKT